MTAALIAPALLLAPQATAAAPAPAAHDPNLTTVYVDIGGDLRVEPRRIFLTANAGQYLRKLAWSDWGSGKATASGKFISDCASCPPPAVRDATVTATRQVTCEDEHVKAYRRIVVRLSEPSEGSDVTKFRIPGGCP